MLKIEKTRGEHATVIKLIGRVQAEFIPELRAQIGAAPARIIFDMEQVTLVDVEVVRFLSECEARRIELRNCSAYIREWIVREK
jgi:anti-anti-sigma regulatory factor